MAVNTGKIQGKHREFNLNLNVATLQTVKLLVKVVSVALAFLRMLSIKKAHTEAQ